MENIIKTLFVLLSLISLNSNAAIIELTDFDGSETSFDFNSLVSSGTDRLPGAFVSPDFSILSGSSLYSLQPFGGFAIGGTFIAYNSSYDGTVDLAKVNDLTITFNNTVSLFGMLFGTSSTGSIDVTVSTFDSENNLLDTISFENFTNGFLGFSSTAGIKSIFIDRTEGDGRFTFVDDLRYVFSAPSNSADLSEPATVSFFSALAFLMVFLQKRKESK